MERPGMVHRGEMYLAAAAFTYGSEHGAAGRPQPATPHDVDPPEDGERSGKFPPWLFDRYLAGWRHGHAHRAVLHESPHSVASTVEVQPHDATTIPVRVRVLPRTAGRLRVDQARPGGADVAL